MPSLLWSQVSAQIPHVDLRGQDLKLVISILEGSSLALHLTSDLRVQRAFEAVFSGARKVVVLGWGKFTTSGRVQSCSALIGALRGCSSRTPTSSLLSGPKRIHDFLRVSGQAPLKGCAGPNMITPTL